MPYRPRLDADLRYAIKWLLVLLALMFWLAVAHPAYGYSHRVERWRPVLKTAARHYHLSAARTRWIVRKGLHIIHGESRGNVHTGSSHGCLGLFQFDTGWKHHITIGHRHYRDFRWSGRASCFRFVKVYKVGGKRAIRRHWRATFGDS